MNEEDITSDSWKEYPNNHHFHLRCDMKLLRDSLLDTLEWIMAVPNLEERLRLVMGLKDELLQVMNLQGSRYDEGVQQIRNALIYDVFVKNWRRRDAIDKEFGFGMNTDSADWSYASRNYWTAYGMTTITKLNMKQIQKVVEDEFNRRCRVATQAMRKAERQRAESGLPRPVGELKANPGA